jgi:hypothetical protein
MADQQKVKRIHRENGRFARISKDSPEGVERAAEAAESGDETREALESATNTVQPIVRKLPPNFRLVLCDVGPHSNVRVMVRPNNAHYLPRMVIPMDVDLTNFNPGHMLIYDGKPPRRKGYW